MMEFLRGKVTPKDWAAVMAILGITAVIAGLFFFVFYRSQMEELERVRGDAEAMELQLQKARTIATNFEQLQQEVDKIQSLVADFEKRLPTSRELRQLVSNFEQLANEAELQVELVPGARIIDSRKETIPYRVTAYGNFHQIVSFINRLERYERYLKVSDLEIEEQEQGVSRAEFTLSTYTFIEQSATPAPAQSGA